MKINHHHARRTKEHSPFSRLALGAIVSTLILPGICADANAQAAPVPPPAPAVAAAAPALPYGAMEVVKLYRGGISKDVIIGYINSTTLPYHLNADGIIYLHNLGLPQDVTEAMLLRDGQLQQSAIPPQYTQSPQPAPAPVMPDANPYATAMAQPPPQQVVVPSTPAPSVTVIGSDYGGYSYPYYSDYPYYSYYPYYYGGVYAGWPLGWGWGWARGGWGWGYGRGWGYGGFRGGYGGGFGGGFHGGFGGGSFHGGGGFGGRGGGGHR